MSTWKYVFIITLGVAALALVVRKANYEESERVTPGLYQHISSPPTDYPSNFSGDNFDTLFKLALKQVRLSRTERPDKEWAFVIRPHIKYTFGLRNGIAAIVASDSSQSIHIQPSPTAKSDRYLKVVNYKEFTSGYYAGGFVVAPNSDNLEIQDSDALYQKYRLAIICEPAAPYATYQPYRRLVPDENGEYGKFSELQVSIKRIDLFDAKTGKVKCQAKPSFKPTCISTFP